MNAGVAFRLYAEMSPRAALGYAIKWHIIGLLLLVAHVILVKQSVLFFPVTLCLLCWIYLNAPLAGLLACFQILIYQNWVISLFSPDMAPFTFTILQGTNFATAVMLATIAASRLMMPPWKRDPGISGIVMVIALAISLAALYAVVGAAREGPTSAAIYFREFTFPAFAALIGLDVGRVWGFKTITTGLVCSAVLSLVIAVIEILLPLDYYAWINAVDFSNLKIASCCLYTKKLYSPEDVVLQNTSGLFNLSGEVGLAGAQTPKSFRFMSTVMHPISYAYVLAVMSLIAVSKRHGHWLLLLVTIPLLIIIGVKGAAILFMLSICLYVVWWGTRNRSFLIVIGLMMLSLYVGYGLIHGLMVQDYHVLGFLGGVSGFMHNPIGQGLGVGGNLSAVADRGFSWSGSGGFQRTGADFSLESAVGVLIYQMGIGALAIFAVFIVLLKLAPFMKRYRRPQRSDIMFIALAVVMANGVFQEEAYAPTAAGLIALLCAVLVINGQRQALSLSRTVTLSKRLVLSTA